MSPRRTVRHGGSSRAHMVLEEVGTVNAFGMLIQPVLTSTIYQAASTGRTRCAYVCGWLNKYQVLDVPGSSAHTSYQMVAGTEESVCL